MPHIFNTEFNLFITNRCLGLQLQDSRKLLTYPNIFFLSSGGRFRIDISLTKLKLLCVAFSGVVTSYTGTSTQKIYCLKRRVVKLLKIKLEMFISINSCKIVQLQIGSLQLQLCINYIK